MTSTLLSCIDSKLINFTNFYAKFELGPFASGQSLTFANTLRRCLLSLPGTAIIFVEINGADHEYDTVLGIRECTLDILLNLKQVVLKSDFDLYEPQIGFLNKTGPSVVRARDLNLPFFMSCIDPDQYIATLTNKGKLNLKCLIVSGKNYLTHTPSSDDYAKWIGLLNQSKPSSLQNLTQSTTNTLFPTVYQKWKKNQTKGLFNFFFEWPSNKKFYCFLKSKKLALNTNGFTQMNQKKNNKKILNSTVDPIVKSFISSNDQRNRTQTKQGPVKNQRQLKTNKIGYFPLDVCFCPIVRVNYTIELKDHLTNQETIYLELWTNGSIDPRSAMHKSVKNIIQLFLPFQQLKSSLFLNSFNNSLTHRVFLKKKTKTGITNHPCFKTEKSNVILKKINSPFLCSQCLSEPRLLKKPDKQRLNGTLKINQIGNHQTKKKLNANPLSFTLNDNPLYGITKKMLLLDIINLSFSPKLYSLLKNVNIHTIKDLLLTPKKRILQIPNLTPEDFKEIQWVKKYKFKSNKNTK